MKSEKLKMKRGLALRSAATKGFTLIELLIVIALIGILAVALLSAINPLEQLRKGRDSARKADASELLNAIERFYTSYQCYPWSWTGSSCSATPARLGSGSAVNPSFSGAGNNVGTLLTVNELKGEFSDRLNTPGNPSQSRLWMIENDYTTNVAGQVSVCYEPESQTGRNGGLGRITTPSGVSSSCTGNYAGGTTVIGTSSCTVCVPQ